MEKDVSQETLFQRLKGATYTKDDAIWTVREEPPVAPIGIEKVLRSFVTDVLRQKDVVYSITFTGACSFPLYPLKEPSRSQWARCVRCGCVLQPQVLQAVCLAIFVGKKGKKSTGLAKVLLGCRRHEEGDTPVVVIPSLMSLSKRLVDGFLCALSQVRCARKCYLCERPVGSWTTETCDSCTGDYDAAYRRYAQEADVETPSERKSESRAVLLCITTALEQASYHPAGLWGDRGLRDLSREIHVLYH